jgi:hypothetical protein
MEIQLRAALLGWLTADAGLAAAITQFVEEAPRRVSLPWLGIVASASGDWGTKTERGREVRVALELHCRGDRPGDAGDLVAAIERRIEAFPRAQAGFAVVSVRFLRARAEQRDAATRAVLLEYRFRLISN